jgi:hypothetical protein
MQLASALFASLHALSWVQQLSILPSIFGQARHAAHVKYEVLALLHALDTQELKCSATNPKMVT